MVATNNSCDTDLTLPTKKIHFRVAIKRAEDWKIRSIAQFKKRQLQKSALSASSSSNNTSEGISCNNPSKNSDKKIPSKKAKSEGSDGDVDRPSVDAPVPTSSSAVPTLKMEIPLQQKQHQLDAWIRELEVFAQNSIASKERIKQLHVARSQLLWLLRKASRHERQMVNANLSSFASENP